MTEQLVFDLDPDDRIHAPSRKYTLLDAVSIALQGNVEDLRMLARAPVATFGHAFLFYLAIPAMVVFLSVFTLFTDESSAQPMLFGIMVALCAWALYLAVTISVLHVAGQYFGQGKLEQFFFLFTAYAVPLQMVMLIFGLLPALGNTVSILLSFYSLLLSLRAIQAVYSITSWRALFVCVAANAAGRIALALVVLLFAQMFV